MLIDQICCTRNQPMAYFPVVVLSSVVMGLLLTPMIYVAIGALSGFAMAFAFLSLPSLLACTLILSYRFLARPGVRESSRARFSAVESIAWLLVGSFLFVISDFTLLTLSERVGLFCTLLLIASFLAAPWMALRPCALVVRIAQWPKPLVLACSLSATVLLIMGSAIYLYKPDPFL
ncbi:hypothetical protein [Acidovorax sp. BLS4]|uniref:hypothetical protein n=2 Tax=unclassified Acidovorax TaxID=2684926 RepID=UPI00294251F4|nr:hypothetical protein [Paracidovorax avenae]WOI47648.1 hypothetical protein R1Z03_10730 [Paracidovorax avenae]